MLAGNSFNITVTSVFSLSDVITITDCTYAGIGVTGWHIKIYWHFVDTASECDVTSYKEKTFPVNKISSM
jgi:hypothetical protein